MNILHKNNILIYVASVFLLGLSYLISDFNFIEFEIQASPYYPFAKDKNEYPSMVLNKLIRFSLLLGAEYLILLKSKNILKKYFIFRLPFFPVYLILGHLIGINSFMNYIHFITFSPIILILFLINSNQTYAKRSNHK